MLLQSVLSISHHRQRHIEAHCQTLSVFYTQTRLGFRRVCPAIELCPSVAQQRLFKDISMLDLDPHTSLWIVSAT